MKLNVPLLGDFTLNNMLDWLVVFVMAAIMLALSFLNGGTHIETHKIIIPLFSLLVIVHVLYLYFGAENEIHLSRIPLYFIPFLLWALVSVLFLSPVAWRGWHQFIYFFEAFIFFWVAINNVRTRAHFSFLLGIAILPILASLVIAIFQFFQDSSFVFNLFGSKQLLLNPEHVGRVTGIFVEPESLAVLLLAAMPWAFIACAVPRLPIIIRVLSFYIFLALVLAIIVTQTLWAVVVGIVACLLAVFFSYKKTANRIKLSLSLILGLLGLVFLLVFAYDGINRGFEKALNVHGEGYRLFIWPVALKLFLSSPIIGIGGGSFAQFFELVNASPIPLIPDSTSSDFVLLLTEYGLIGFVLFAIPMYTLFRRALNVWYNDFHRVYLKALGKKVMPIQRFFLSIALGGVICFFQSFFLASLWNTPLLLLYVAIFLSVLIKASNVRDWVIKKSLALKFAVLVSTVFVVAILNGFLLPIVRSLELTTLAREQIDTFLSQDSESDLSYSEIDTIIEDLNTAIELYSKNEAAWLALGSAYTLKYFTKPNEYQDFSKKCTTVSENALLINPRNWNGWANLAIAQAMRGAISEADASFEKAYELAPHSSKLNYYRAAFLAQLPGRNQDALDSVNLSLKMNPFNENAKRLRVKLLIQ